MKKKNQTVINKIKGFTLVELLLYMGLFSLLTVVLTDILVTTVNIQLTSSSSNNIVQDGRYIYSRFIYDINQAQSVILPQNLGDGSNSLEFTKNGNSYSYTLEMGNIILTDHTGSYQLNGYDTSISDLSFRRIGNINGKHTFRINFTISGKTTVNGNTEIRHFQTTAGLR